MDTIVRLDTRGRLVIPNEFRESLDLRRGDSVLLSLDKASNSISISPVYGDQQNLVLMDIEFGDAPGSLAEAASILAKLGVDLVMTESKSFQRGARARWNIIADVSGSGKPVKEIQREIRKSKKVESVSIENIARGSVHR